MPQPDTRRSHEPIRRGDTVTCENGHAVVDMARGLRTGDILSLSAFTNWRSGQAQPRKGDPIKPCHCGARYVIQHCGAYGGLHFADGWRP